MQNVQTSAKITEGKATDFIFDACRANEDRNNWKNAEGYAVTFKRCADGTHEAALRDPCGEVVALANVDSFDC